MSSRKTENVEIQHSNQIILKYTTGSERKFIILPWYTMFTSPGWSQNDSKCCYVLLMPYGLTVAHEQHK